MYDIFGAPEQYKEKAKKISATTVLFSALIEKMCCCLVKDKLNNRPKMCVCE